MTHQESKTDLYTETIAEFYLNVGFDLYNIQIFTDSEPTRNT